MPCGRWRGRLFAVQRSSMFRHMPNSAHTRACARAIRLWRRQRCTWGTRESVAAQARRIDCCPPCAHDATKLGRYQTLVWMSSASRRIPPLSSTSRSPLFLSMSVICLGIAPTRDDLCRVPDRAQDCAWPIPRPSMPVVVSIQVGRPRVMAGEEPWVNVVLQERGDRAPQCGDGQSRGRRTG